MNISAELADNELGMTYEYFEKADGTHAMLAPSLEKVFAFFNKHRHISRKR